MSAKIAIIANEENLLLETLLDVWVDSALIDCEIALVSASASECEAVLYNGRPIAFKDIKTFNFEQVQCVIILSPAIVVEAYKELLSSISCPVLGFLDNLKILSPVAFDGRSLQKAKCFGVLQSPIAALQYVLEDIGCESLDATILYPASFYGKQGVQELATQTTRLLNAQAFECHLFDQQMPFNYFPMSANSSGVEIEQQLLVELALVFPDVDIHLSAIQMPVFYGVSLLVSVVLDTEVNLEDFKTRLSKKELIHYQELARQLSNKESVDQNGSIVLGNLRKSESDHYRMDFWMGFDDVKFSASHSLISAAEFLLKHDL